MQEEQERIKEMFERYRQGRCTRAEHERIHAWLNHYAQHEANGLDEFLAKSDARTRSRKILRKWIPYAAAILIAGGMIWYYPSLNKRLFEKQDIEMVRSEDVAPGGNRATLTLADGRRIVLSESHTGIRLAGSYIVYDDGREQVVDLGADKVEQLSLVTPRGGTYQLTLPDGTLVWLNAESTLTYPSSFEGDSRVVSIDGEAYFSVAKDDRKPFRVLSRGQEIEVVGTEFNVDTYSDIYGIKTTLVEGSVRIKPEDARGKTQILSPGQQSVINGEEIGIRQVDVSSAIAWKKGEFYFDNTPLEDMLQQIARWYAIDVVYEKSIPKELFTGVISRNVSLQTVLEFLRISEISYRIQGNQLIIN